MAPLRRLAALLVVAAIGSCLGTEHEEETQQLPVACPVNSWCLPTGLCDPDYVIFDAKNPMEGSAPGEYVCGVTDTTVNYVCCDTQELLPHHFKPTPFRWYFQRKGSNIEGGLVVAPWPTFTIDDLEELENQNEVHIDDDDDFEKDIHADGSKQGHDASEGEDINDGYVVEPDNFPSPTRNDGISNEDLLAQADPCASRGISATRGKFLFDAESSHEKPALSAQCGRGAEVGLHARVTTQRGEDGVTGYGEYPWHVAVLTVDLTYLCAGVLVAPRLVLTVAHCVTPLPAGTPLVVRVGDWDLASERELYPAYDVEVVRAVVHPVRFFRQSFTRVTCRTTWHCCCWTRRWRVLPHVQPACLPPPHAQFDHQHCWVPGWGQARHVSGDIHDPSSYSWVLREAPVAVVTPGACQHHLRTTHLGPFYQLPRTR
ncbi:Phenoloxidase-activating factor 2 [Amphibalanus amphitrite]|uniref:Phenoloxidase-activating factor 2 n=1 Tax=Amphibalanus amphitrite TaxID=1232801 RepID=A0A6A4V138_AMPAM|nr:Phenoloxidase-activating factor 2 [Amphibalanus amphitrite]